MHELAASVCTSRSEDSEESVRAIVRFHHVQSRMKRGYLRLWADDLEIRALLAVGQPGMLLAEGPLSKLQAFLDRAMKMLHWGPTPCRIVASCKATGLLLSPGLAEVSDVFPHAVKAGGAYNHRDSIDFQRLAQALVQAGHTDSGSLLQSLASSAFAHTDGRVQEASDGSGWVGYAEPAQDLDVFKQPCAVQTKANRKWRIEKTSGSSHNDNETKSTGTAEAQPLATPLANGKSLDQTSTIRRRWGGSGNAQ